MSFRNTLKILFDFADLCENRGGISDINQKRRWKRTNLESCLKPTRMSMIEFKENVAI